VLRAWAVPRISRRRATRGTESKRTEVDQARANRFADAIDDHRWIHFDPDRAQPKSPFGGKTSTSGESTMTPFSNLTGREIALVMRTSLAVKEAFELLRAAGVSDTEIIVLVFGDTGADQYLETSKVRKWPN
jgi:hypothetical protein